MRSVLCSCRSPRSSHAVANEAVDLNEDDLADEEDHDSLAFVVLRFLLGQGPFGFPVLSLSASCPELSVETSAGNGTPNGCSKSVAAQQSESATQQNSVCR